MASVDLRTYFIVFYLIWIIVPAYSPRQRWQQDLEKKLAHDLGSQALHELD